MSLPFNNLNNLLSSDSEELPPLGLHLGPSPLPNFMPVSVGAPLPRRYLKTVPLPEVDKVPMPGDHWGGEEEEEDAASEKTIVVKEDTEEKVATGPFYSELDVQADAYGRRNRPRLDPGPSKLTYISGHTTSASAKSSPASSPNRRGRGIGRLHASWRVANVGVGVVGVSTGVASCASETRNEVYESVTCMPGCEGYSFEELRVECYAASYMSTGEPPRSPRPDEGYIFPPAFEPFATITKSPNDGPGRDIVMSDQPNLVSAFTFNMPASTQH